MSSTLRLVLVLATVTVTAVFASTANAAGRNTEVIQCGGSTLTILTQPAAHDNFGAVQVVGDGTLIPLAFEFTVTDLTKGIVLFSDSLIKGSGRTPPGVAGSVMTCISTDTATLGDLLEPGETPPPGTDLTDTVQFLLTATVVKIR
jgi:hypothetical protein